MISPLEELVKSVQLILLYPDSHNIYDVAKYLIDEEEEESGSCISITIEFDDVKVQQIMSETIKYL